MACLDTLSLRVLKVLIRVLSVLIRVLSASVLLAHLRLCFVVWCVVWVVLCGCFTSPGVTGSLAWTQLLDYREGVRLDLYTNPKLGIAEANRALYTQTW